MRGHLAAIHGLGASESRIKMRRSWLSPWACSEPPRSRVNPPRARLAACARRDSRSAAYTVRCCCRAPCLLRWNAPSSLASFSHDKEEYPCPRGTSSPSGRASSAARVCRRSRKSTIRRSLVQGFLDAKATESCSPLFTRRLFDAASRDCRPRLNEDRRTSVEGWAGSTAARRFIARPCGRTKRDRLVGKRSPKST